MKRTLLTLIIMMISLTGAWASSDILKNTTLARSYFYIGFENRGELGYTKSLFTGIWNDLQIHKWHVYSNIWFSPSNKIGVGNGNYLDYEIKLAYPIGSGMAIESGISFNHTHTDQWTKNAIKYEAGINFEKNPVEFYVDGVYSNYNGCSV